ncbi:MAG: acyl-CoA dehydrogenase family protein [Bacteroidia bacterium]
MALIINEEQQMLKTSARDFLKAKSPITELRRLRDTQDPLGYDPQVWAEMAEMGWASLAIPEAYGGLGFGYTGLGQILEEMGRTLTASPMVATVLLCATAIEKSTNLLQKEACLGAIAEGKLIMAFAHEEGNFHQSAAQNVKANPDGDDYLISGTKHFVLDGHIADKLVVSAFSEGVQKTMLFVVDTKASGININKTEMMDSRNAATISFDNVKVSAADRLESGDEHSLLDYTLDVARIGLAAEMLGGITEAFDRTLVYLKERQQFGVPIGSFQALQHRMAIMFGEIELCKSVVIKALQAIDGGSSDLGYLASLAKAKLGQTYKLVSNEGIQMFGGIGMTDDEEIGFFLKRARVAQQSFGDTNFHLDRLANLKGY